MTENNTSKERVEEMIKEELGKMDAEPQQKESIFEKTKKALTSDTAKKVYSAMAMGVVQGALARFTFDTLGELESEDVVLEIED